MFVGRFCIFFHIVIRLVFIFFFKQKTAYEMRISDWSSDVCSSDLALSMELNRDNLPSYATCFLVFLVCMAIGRKGHSWPVSYLGVLSYPLYLLHQDIGLIVIALAEPHLGLEIGRAHVWTPVTNAHLVCRLLLEKKKKTYTYSQL